MPRLAAHDRRRRRNPSGAQLGVSGPFGMSNLRQIDLRRRGLSPTGPICQASPGPCREPLAKLPSGYRLCQGTTSQAAASSLKGILQEAPVTENNPPPPHNISMINDRSRGSLLFPIPCSLLPTPWSLHFQVSPPLPKTPVFPSNPGRFARFEPENRPKTALFPSPFPPVRPAAETFAASGYNGPANALEFFLAY